MDTSDWNGPVAREFARQDLSTPTRNARAGGMTIDAVIDEAIASLRIVGAVVVAERDGESVYRRAAGYADRGGGGRAGRILHPHQLGGERARSGSVRSDCCAGSAVRESRRGIRSGSPGRCTNCAAWRRTWRAYDTVGQPAQ